MTDWMQKWCNGHPYLAGAACYRDSLWDKVSYDVRSDAVRDKDTQNSRSKAIKLQAMTFHTQQNNTCFEGAHSFQERMWIWKCHCISFKKPTFPSWNAALLVHCMVPSSRPPAWSRSACPISQQVLCHSYANTAGGREREAKAKKEFKILQWSEKEKLEVCFLSWLLVFTVEMTAVSSNCIPTVPS